MNGSSAADIISLTLVICLPYLQRVQSPILQESFELCGSNLSIQFKALAWNGQYFLIGGVGFLAEYNPSTSTVNDLTPQLDSVLGGQNSLADGLVNSVNSIAWTGNSWILAGGAPIGFEGSERQSAWVASYKPASTSSCVF